MRYMILLALISLCSCAGFRVPFTEHHTMRWMFESGHDTLNSDCIEMSQLRAVAGYLNNRHIGFLNSKNERSALDVAEFKASIGSKCDPVLVGLTTGQIQTELFGTSQNIPNPEKLRELGGLLFEYQDITTDSGLRTTLHLEQEWKGPERRLVAIYRLVDGKIIHFQASGKDNVDRRKIQWPVTEFFGFVLKEGAGAIKIK